LLAFLALNEIAITRVRIAGVLWSMGSEERAAGNLRTALWRLRSTGVHLVTAEYDYVRLSSHVEVDIREGTRLARAALDPTTDVSELAFEDLPFVGELLPGWYEDWIAFERERHRQVCLHALETLCDRWTRAGYHTKAIKAGLAAVAGEPLRESAHRALIRAYLSYGNSGEAVRQYAACRQVLHDELHIQPSAQISALMEGLHEAQPGGSIPGK
jgi:DNA-binding SARP family transcriptional activator